MCCVILVFKFFLLELEFGYVVMEFYRGNIWVGEIFDDEYSYNGNGMF